RPRATTGDVLHRRPATCLCRPEASSGPAWTAAGPLLLLPDENPRLVGHALVEVDDVLVEQSHAAGGYRLADRLPFRRTMQAIERVLAVLEDVEGPRAERIVEARRHAAIVGGIFGKLRPAADHILRRGPF